MARAAAEGAYYNIVINLPDIEDEDFRQRILTEGKALRSQALHLEEDIKKIVESELDKNLGAV